MINKIFQLAVRFFEFFAKRLHITYNEVNVVAYYFLVPLSWTIMGDIILREAYITVAFLSIWVGIAIATDGRFSQWCDEIFEKSVNFLLWFRHIGWNYFLSSIIICLVVPAIIYIALILLLLRAFGVT